MSKIWQDGRFHYVSVFFSLLILYATTVCHGSLLQISLHIFLSNFPDETGIWMEKKTKHFSPSLFLPTAKTYLGNLKSYCFVAVCVCIVSDRWTFAKTTKISLCTLANRNDGLAMQYYTQKYTHNHSQGNVAGWDSVFLMYVRVGCLHLFVSFHVRTPYKRHV